MGVSKLARTRSGVSPPSQRALLKTGNGGATVEARDHTREDTVGNHQHEDERYKKYYNPPPHGEVPQDPKVRAARQAGSEVEGEEPTSGEPAPDGPASRGPAGGR